MKGKKIVPQWVAMAMLLYGMTESLCTTFLFAVDKKTYMIPLIVLSAVITGMSQLRRKWFVCAGLVYAGVISAGFVIGYQRIKMEIPILVYHISDIAKKYFGRVVIPKTMVKEGRLEMSYLLLLGISTIGLLIGIIGFRWKMRRLSITIIMIVSVFAGMILGRTPQVKGLIFVFVGSVILLYETSCKKKTATEIINVHTDNKGTKGAVYVVGIAFLLISIVMGMWITKRVHPYVKKHNKEFLQKQHDAENKLKESITEIANYVKGFTWKDSDGRLSNAAPVYRGRKILEVTVPKLPKEDVYLRGFIGQHYANGQWSEVYEEDVEANNVAKYAKKAQSADYHIYKYGYMYTNDVGEDYWDDYWMQIKHIEAGKNSKYAYLPYYSDIEKAVGISGKRKGRVFDCYTDQAVLRKQNVYRLPVHYVTKEDREEIFREEMSLPPKNPWEDEGLTEEEKEEIYRWWDYFFYAANHYGPDDLNIGKIRSYVWDYDLAGRSKQEMVDFVKSHLEENAEYSLDLSEVPDDMDYMEYFLFEEKKGYCEHFATAATLMFRCLGMPSRYVSGYRIEADDFTKNEDGTYTATVLDSDAHAWTEIYSDGTGWYPCEVTPASEHTANETVVVKETKTPESAAKEMKSTVTKKEEKSAQEKTHKHEESNEEKQSQKEKKAEEDIENRIWHFLIVTAVFTGLIVQYCIRLTMHRNRLKHLEENRNKWVCVRTGYMMRYLKQCRIKEIEKMSERQWILRSFELAKSTIDEVELKHLLSIMERAAFSKNQISKEEKNYVADKMAYIEKQMYTSAKKWWMCISAYKLG